ncbi:MAG: PAS domain S-box protein, partial [Acidobacteriota bacterium]
MTLRKKTFFIVGITLIGLIGVSYLVSSTILMQGFNDLETQSVRENVMRATKELSDIIDGINHTTGDWANWNEAYQYVEDRNPDFIQSAITDKTFVELRLNLILISDASGRIVLAKAFDLDEDREAPVPRQVIQHIAQHQSLLRHEKESSVHSGLIQVFGGLPPMLIASRPLLTSEGKGPIRGAMLMGRYLDKFEVDRLSDTTQMSISLRVPNGAELPFVAEVVDSPDLTHGEPLVKPVDENFILGLLTLPDIYGNPSLELRVQMPRDIRGHGRLTMWCVFLSLLAGGLVFGLVTLMLMERWVLSRLVGLSQSVESVGESGALDTGVFVSGNDEISSLAGSINIMLRTIGIYQNRLLKSQEDLELRVRKRTEQLAKAYEALLKEISERERAEKACRESEACYEAIVEDQTELISRFLPNERLIFVNDAYCRFFGESRQELIGSNFWHHIPATESDRLRTYIAGLNRENPCAMIEHSVMSAEGEFRWLQWTDRAICDDKGDIIEYQSVGRDITERKRAETALMESEKRYRELADFLSLALFEMDGEGMVTFANHALCSLLGYEQADFERGLNAADLLDSEGGEWLLGRMLDEAGKPEGHEYTAIRKDGAGVRIVAYVSPILDGEGVVGLRGAFIDVTERKKTEIEMLKIQKLESVGILAGGIAHDFNNILTAIVGNLSLARLQAAETGRSELIARLDESEKAALRAKDLTGQLLTFSRGGAPVKSLVSVSEIIKDSTLFCLSGSKCGCEFSIPDDLWAAEVDAGQISQVVNNLIINADQAMTAGGTIRVSAENVLIDGSTVPPLDPGRYIRVSVEDQGAGIPQEHLSKIFDPYFTTKSNGNGLGLAMVYSIISRHGGHITVESEPGRGTVFRMLLPASEKQAPPSVRVDQQRNSRGRASGLVLVLDDEASICEIASKMLAFIGYETICASEGAEAVELYRSAMEAGKPFDVVIMDLTIRGGMGGGEAIQRLIG